MSGRLYVHVGPPKTATTSLQLALQNLRLDGFTYAGVFQPRDPNARSLASSLYEASSGALSPTSSEVRRAIDQIKTLISSGNSVVLSEEMFVLGTRTHFQEKLTSLAALLHGIPTTFIITVREPIEALQSYYQERFERIPLSQKISFARFCRHHAAQCYDYVALTGMLRGLGFHDVRLIRFEEVVGGGLTLGHLLGDKGWLGQRLELDVANQSNRSSGTSRRKFPPLTVSLMQVPVAGRLLRALARRKLIAPRAALWMTRVVVGPATSRRLEAPEDVRRHLQQSYSATLEALHDKGYLEEAREQPAAER